MKATTFAAGMAVILSSFAMQPALAQAQPKPVTKDELRACLNGEAVLVTRRADLETRSKANQVEVEAIKAEVAVLTEDAKKVDETNPRRVREFKARTDAFNQRRTAAIASADTWDKDLAEFNRNLTSHNEKCGGIAYSKEDKDDILKEMEAAKKK